MKKNETGSIVQVIAFPVLLGFILTLILMAICSFVVWLGKMSNSQISNLSLVCLAVGSFFTSWLAARLAQQKRLIWGFVAGLCLFGCMAILSLAWLGQTVDFMRIAINFAVSIVTAVLGSMLGASMKRKRYKK